ncbi:9512_t:CDS:2, partial [Entrophospora sp. SA101]
SVHKREKGSYLKINNVEIPLGNVIENPRQPEEHTTEGLRYNWYSKMPENLASQKTQQSVRSSKIDDFSIEAFANWLVEYATAYGLNKEYITNSNLLRWYKDLLRKWQMEQVASYIREKIDTANIYMRKNNLAKQTLENLSKYTEHNSSIINPNPQDNQTNEIFNLAGFKDAEVNNDPIINLILQHDLSFVPQNDPIRSGHLLANLPHPLLYNKDPGSFDNIMNRDNYQFKNLVHPSSTDMAKWFFGLYKRDDFPSLCYFERPEFLIDKDGYLVVEIASNIQLSVKHYQKTMMNSQSICSEATWINFVEMFLKRIINRINNLAYENTSSTAVEQLNYIKENGEVGRTKPDGTVYFVSPEIRFPVCFVEGQKPNLPNSIKKSQTDAEKLLKEIKLASDNLLKDLQDKHSVRISREIAQKIFKVPFITCQITDYEAVITVSDRTLHPVLTTWELCRFRIDFHKPKGINDVRRIFEGIFILMGFLENIDKSWNEIFTYLADASQILPRSRHNLSAKIIPLHHYILGEYEALNYDYQSSKR